MFSNLSITSILSILKGLISLGNNVVSYMDKKQLMDAGEVKQQQQNLEEARNAVSKAITIRRNARSKFKSDGMSDDYKHYRKK